MSEPKKETIYIEQDDISIHYLAWLEETCYELPDDWTKKVTIDKRLHTRIRKACEEYFKVQDILQDLYERG